MSTIDVIEFGGNSEDFVWKYPSKDFSTLTQLIVNESHEALLYRDGKAYDLLPPGKHTLTTKNIPLFSQSFKLHTGDKIPFQCEIYFVNKTEKMAIKWGTRMMNYLDPTCNNYAFPISAYGVMNLNVFDARKLVVKLVGERKSIDAETIRDYFKTPITTYVCSELPKYLREKAVSVFSIDEHINEFSKVLSEKIAPEMMEYGIALEKFWIDEITKPEHDPVYREINRQRGAQVTLIGQGSLDIQQANIKVQEEIVRHNAAIQMGREDAELRRYINETLGIREKERIEQEVLLHVADNPGGGSSVQNAMVGVGMGMATAGMINQTIGSYAHDIFGAGPIMPMSGENCPIGEMPNPVRLKEETNIPSMEKQEDDEIRKKLRKLKIAWEEGCYTDEEYRERREKLMNLD